MLATTAFGAEMLPSSQVVALPEPNDPTICFRFWFRVGSQNDPPGKEGLAALTADMLTEAATKQNSYEQILAKLFPLAGGYAVQTSVEMTVVVGRIHRDNLAKYCPLLMQAVREPALLQEDLNRLKSRTLNHLQNALRYTNDEELGKAVLYNTIFRGTPYGHLPEGTIQGVKSITVEDVRDFHRRYYTRQNVVLGLGGGFDAVLLEKLRCDLASFPDGVPPRVPPPMPPPIHGRRVVIVEKDAGATAISLGFPISLLRGRRDWYALAVANSFFGEHRNSKSHLFQVIRAARGLNYGDYSYIEHFPHGGTLTMPPTNVARRRQIFEIWLRPVPNAARVFALRAVLRELKLLVEDGLTEQQFAATQDFLRKYTRHYAPTAMDRLAYALDDKYYGIRGSHLKSYPKMLDQLTRAEVNASVRKYLQYENLQIVIVTPEAEALKKALTSDAPSLYKYPSPKSKLVREEDRQIQRFPLKISPEQVTIMPVDEVFEK